MKLIILDRDGVINEDSDAYVKSVDEWLPIPGSCQAIAKLYQQGYQVYIATNQSGLGRGYFTEQDLAAMHAKMTTLVKQAGGRIAGVFYCPHSPEDNCDCRKPKPGLFHQIANASQTDLNGVPVIGDSLRDLEAGIAVGCEPILVRTGKGEASETKLASATNPALQQAKVFTNLAAAVDFLLQRIG